MFQILKYVNFHGDEITFTSPYLLEKVSGLTEAEATHTTYQGVRQNGETYRYSDFEKREITIDFNVIADSRDAYMNLRNELLKVLNPITGEGYLYYTYGTIERRIKCIPSSSPILPIEGRKNYTEGSITFIAFNPFFEDVSETVYTFATTTNATKSKYFEVKGHVPTPVTIEVTGTIQSLRIQYAHWFTLADVPNYKARKSYVLKFSKAISQGQKLTISTEYGNKKVTISEDGKADVNAFNYITIDSDFFELEPGISDNNLIQCYDYIVNSNTNFNITIKFRNRYLGV